MTANPQDEIFDLLDMFVTEAINICDEPHGKLSNKAKVGGMRRAFVLMKCVIEKCRTPEGRAELTKEMEKK